MTKLELAIRIIVDDYKETLNTMYSDWDITNWSELLEAFGQTSTDARNDVEYILMKYSNDNGVDMYLDDDHELQLEDGSFISYRKLMNAVRKELFK